MAAKVVKQATPQLPDEVLIEIFLKLPVRSIFLFRSVCKHWLNLIQNPYFITLHTNRPIDNNNNNNNNSHDDESMLIVRTVEESGISKPKTRNIVLTLLSDDYDETTILPYKRVDVALGAVSPSMAERGLFLKEGKLNLMGPCNGVFCLTDRVDVVLFNPATRQCRKVPSFRLTTHGSGRWQVETYFDCVGFGFDHISNDYKIVRFRFNVQGKFGSFGVYNDDDDDDDDSDNGDDEHDDDDDNDDDDDDDDDDSDNGDDEHDDDDDNDDDDSEYDVVDNDGRQFKVEIFSLTTKGWRELDRAVSDFQINRIQGHSLFFNGAIHWLEGPSYEDICSILVFDLNKEAFNRFELPFAFSHITVSCVRLAILDESLAMVSHRRLDKDVEFEIWSMDEYGFNSSWTVLYKISSVYGIDQPLSISKEKEFLAVDNHGELAVLNLNTGVIKGFQVHGVRGTFHAFRYRETLVSLE